MQDIDGAPSRPRQEIAQAFQSFGDELLARQTTGLTV
jgi:hypothetical protein